MIHKAIEFAAASHQGQTRKGTDIPYIVHPFEVAQLLTAAGADEALIAAGLLHDPLEDTAITAEEIFHNFGGEVLRLVRSNTEDKSKSWEARKQHTLEYLKLHATYEEALLALADELSNLRSIANDYRLCGNKVWERFNRGAGPQGWYYRGLQDSLAVLEDTGIYEEFSILVQTVFGNDC
jgi:(p)ppGpp synthase/HD superfamily hydrolase